MIVEDSLRPATGKPPKFRVEMRNTGKDDLVLHLGIMLANGRKQYPEAITLIISDFEGESRTFQLCGPVGVRVDPMVVPFPAGATLSLPIDVANYWPVSSEEFDYKLRGGYSIEAKFTGENVPRATNMLLAPNWVGVVTSNQLTFTVSN